MTKQLFALTLMTALVCPALALDKAPEKIATRFKSLYPGTTFKQINKSEISGIYEVVADGDTIAYTDDSGRYFIFGHLFDMRLQKDLTAQRKQEYSKVDFPENFLRNAIKTVHGDGSRRVAVFSDPDCPYCKKLEAELVKINNVTIYTFLYPLESLHPESKSHAVSVWCSADQSKAWSGLMLSGAIPSLRDCSNPINDNLVLGSKLNVVGTPTLIAGDGRVLPGAIMAEQLDAWLGGAQK